MISEFTLILPLGEKFNSDKVNLAELERRAGISRAKLRRIKKSGFMILIFISNLSFLAYIVI